MRDDDEVVAGLSLQVRKLTEALQRAGARLNAAEAEAATTPSRAHRLPFARWASEAFDAVNRFGEYADELPEPRRRSPMTVPGYEVVYRWPDGREEVRYRRPNSDNRIRRDVERIQAKHGDQCPYLVRDIQYEGL